MNIKQLSAVLGAVLATGSAQAIDLNLTTGAATPVEAFGAWWSTTFDSSSGSGVWDPFFDLENHGNNHTEAAYNTDGAFQMDQARTTFNKDLPGNTLTPLTIPGIAVPVYAFWLDANETGGGSDNRFLAIDKINIYASVQASVSVATEAGLAAVSSLLYNMDASGDNRVLIDSTIGTTAGSGSSDLIMYVPASLFAGADPYIYFYNENGFSDANGPYGAHAGFEEWRARTGPPQQQVPDGGATLVLLGGAIASLACVRLKQNRA